jgi:hypothetical protein
MNYAKLISFIFTVLITVHTFAEDGSQVLWTPGEMKDFTTIMKGVSKDVGQFIQDNPDWIADNLGGSTYNKVQKLKELFSWDLLKATKAAWEYYVNGMQEIPVYKDGWDKLCESPRICQGLQYITAQSIVNNTNAATRVDFYIAQNHDATHNYVVAVPKGVPNTPENVKIQGIIIDPFYSQDANQMLYPGSHPNYSDIKIDSEILTPTRFFELFNRDPFNSKPIDPFPDPNPIPNDPPVCLTGNDIWVKDANGNVMNFTSPNGIVGNKIAVDGKGIAYVFRNSAGGVEYGQPYLFGSACEMDDHPEWLSQAVANLPAWKPNYNCVATYSIPAGTIVQDFDLVPHITGLICPQ